jgi:periplasmic protein CpxP/Spy
MTAFRLSRFSRPLRPVRPVRLLLATLLLAGAATLTQTAWAAPGGHGATSMGLMGHPRMVERMLDSVNASAEQRSQIQQIVQAAAPDLRAQREANRKLHEQQATLFAQPSVDARAVETLRQQMLAQHDQTSQRMTQLMLEVSRVLSPEQRKTLADKMTQRRSMMERHRSERAAADGKAP